MVGLGVVTLGVPAALGCSSDPMPADTTVGPENAFIAVVQWELEETEPIVDEDGDVEAPVIYLAAGSGETVDVGVQANVVATIDESAVIRFADQAVDAVDVGVDGEPVKDDGVLLVVDAFESGQPEVDARISRYRSIDDDTNWILRLTATDEGVDVSDAVEADDSTS